MEKFITIHNRKIEHYGFTQAAFEFAVAEYSEMLVKEFAKELISSQVIIDEAFKKFKIKHDL